MHQFFLIGSSFTLSIFFFNLQMTTEWEITFLNTAIIIFCLIVFSCSKIDSFFLLNTQYPFLQNPNFGNISPYRSGSDNFEKIVSTFLFVWFDYCHGRRKRIYRCSQLSLIEYHRFINCYGKANKKRISWHTETWFDINCLLESQ